MLRQIAYCILVTAFAAFAFTGLSGWSNGPRSVETEPLPEDEIPLVGGYINTGPKLVEYGLRGYPFESIRGELIAARRELPPDPAPVSAEDAQKQVERVSAVMKFAMPAGTHEWPRIKEMLTEGIEPWGIHVYFPRPDPPESLRIEIPTPATPDGEWNGYLAYLKAATQGQVAAIGTCEGIAVGTPEALNRAKHDALLIGLRRQVLAENLDPRLDVHFRPDLVDASVLAFTRNAEAQTGIPIVMDAQIWEKAPGLSWRGEPRKLRQALDELCTKFRWFWRWRSGRVWILWPTES